MVMQTQSYKDFKKASSSYVSPTQMEMRRVEEKNKQIIEETDRNTFLALILISSKGKNFKVPELQPIEKYPKENKDFLDKSNDVVYQCGKMCNSYRKKPPKNLKVGNRIIRGSDLVKQSCKNYGNSYGCKLSMPLSPNENSNIYLMGFAKGLTNFGNYIQEEINYGFATCRTSKNNEKVCKIKW